MSSKGMKINRRVNPTLRLNFLTITSREKPFLSEMGSTIQEKVMLWQEESAEKVSNCNYKLSPS